jgi:glycosyltransferase involved in cell wall biosynthesis
LKIFFDFYEIALGKGKSIGIYNYALAILNTLGKQGENDIVVACSGSNLQVLNDIPNIKLKVISSSYPNFKQRIQWRLIDAIRVAKKENADIYYSPKGFAPGLFRRAKNPFVVLTVHDMIPFYYLYNYPKYFSFFEIQFVTKSLNHSLTVANKIITISEYSKQMICENSKRRDGISVVYNGVSVVEDVLKRKTNSPYIFAITSKLPHKNKENLLKGYIEYRKLVINPLPLVVCGISEFDLIDYLEYKTFIKCIPFAGKDEFSSFFSNASLFLYLPKIEGFGFPPIESLMYNVLPVVSDIPVLREVLGDAAYFVNPDQPVAIAQGIISVLSDLNIGNDILIKGQTIISTYTWENCCNKILDVFEETLIENR